MTIDDRLMLLHEHRIYAERVIERCDGTLKVEHLRPYHTKAVEQRRDAAKLAAHYAAQIERIELCSLYRTVSPPEQGARQSTLSWSTRWRN